MTNIMTALIVVAIMLGGILAALTSAVTRTVNAQGVADLAALAGATALLSEQHDPCGLAQQVATAGGHTLEGCQTTTEGELRVRVAVTTIAGTRYVTARAGIDWS